MSEMTQEFREYVEAFRSGRNDSLRGMVRISRFASKSNAEDIGLDVGDRITYQRVGPPVDGVIEQGFCTNGSGLYGYVVRFDDDGDLWFADERHIIDWPGRGQA